MAWNLKTCGTREPPPRFKTMNGSSTSRVDAYCRKTR
jgi:hypothetical protein